MARSKPKADVVVDTVDAGGGILVDVVAPAEPAVPPAEPVKAKKGKKGKAAKAEGDAPAPAVADGAKKCPVCGKDHPVEDAKCPACGFEYGSATLKVLENIDLAPAEITEGRNSRVVAEANYLDTVQARALDIAVHGQITPVEAYRTEGLDGLYHYTLISGFTRKAAVELIRAGFTAVHPITGVEQLFHNPDLKLRVSVVDIKPDQAFIRGIIENVARKNTTDLQEAEAQDVLRQEYGWTDAAISRLYGYTNQNRVAKLRQLLKLDSKTQTLVHEGKLALHAALDTESLTPAEREEIFAAAADGDKVRGETVRSLVRDLYAAKAEASKASATPAKDIPDAGALESDRVGGEVGKLEDPPADPKKIKRSKTEFRNWLAEVAAREDVQAKDVVSDFLGCLDKWLEGDRTDTTLNKKFNALFDAIS